MTVAAPQPLRADGDDVRVATVEQPDLAPYRRAVIASRPRIARWNPVDPDDLAYHLRHQSAVHRTFLIRAKRPEGDHDVVGKVNVSNIVRGRALSATLGYDAYDPYAGRGLFAQGLRLVIGLAFATEPSGLGLHRLEANVQPGNVASAALLRSCGFVRRGQQPSYLYLSDHRDRHAWRDHISYGLLAPECPAAAYRPADSPQPVVIVTAAQGEVSAREIARELAGSLLPADLVTARPGLLDQPGPVVAVVADREAAARLVRDAGLDPARVLIEDGRVDDRRAVVDIALRATARAWACG